ncbi:hypothetical protein CYMTET_32588, partial [Cymbomonas tetramitiformis]
NMKASQKKKAELPIDLPDTGTDLLLKLYMGEIPDYQKVSKRGRPGSQRAAQRASNNFSGSQTARSASPLKSPANALPFAAPRNSTQPAKAKSPRAAKLARDARSVHDSADSLQRRSSASEPSTAAGDCASPDVEPQPMLSVDNELSTSKPQDLWAFPISPHLLKQTGSTYHWPEVSPSAETVHSTSTQRSHNQTCHLEDCSRPLSALPTSSRAKRRRARTEKH